MYLRRRRCGGVKVVCGGSGGAHRKWCGGGGVRCRGVRHRKRVSSDDRAIHPVLYPENCGISKTKS